MYVGIVGRGVRDLGCLCGGGGGGSQGYCGRGCVGVLGRTART